MRCIRKLKDTSLKHSVSRRGNKRMVSEKKLIPVFVEAQDEDSLLFSSHKKFLVPVDMKASQFSNFIRSEMQLPSHQSYSLLLNDTLVSSSRSLGKMYRDHKDPCGNLKVTVVSENTFGCRAPLIRPVSPVFEPGDELAFIDELPGNLPPDVEVIHLTAVVGNPSTNVEQPVSLALSNSIPNFEEHVQGIISAIGEAIMQAFYSDPSHGILLQSSTNAEITINPQLVKEALLDYMNAHSLTFSPPFDIDNFYTVIKMTPAPADAAVPPDE